MRWTSPGREKQLLSVPQSCGLRVEAGCVLRKTDFEVQRVVGFRSTKSLSEGGRTGFRGDVSQLLSNRPSPRPQTTHSRKSPA